MFARWASNFPQTSAIKINDMLYELVLKLKRVRNTITIEFAISRNFIPWFCHKNYARLSCGVVSRLNRKDCSIYVYQSAYARTF